MRQSHACIVPYQRGLLKKPSSMKNSSTQGLPKLERLLLDADVNVELEPLLRAIGFRPKFALQVGVNIRSDVDILRWARRHGSILVCHDKFRDNQTRVELYPELYHRGGKIIQIGGGPDQDPYTSLGKILLSREEWAEWFKNHDGIVTISGQRGMNKKRDALKLYVVVQREMPLEDAPVQTLSSRKPPRQQTKRRQKKEPPPEQQRF